MALIVWWVGGLFSSLVGWMVDCLHNLTIHDRHDGAGGGGVLRADAAREHRPGLGRRAGQVRACLHYGWREEGGKRDRHGRSIDAYTLCAVDAMLCFPFPTIDPSL